MLFESLWYIRNQQPDSFYPEKSHLPSPLPAKLRLPVAAAAPVIERTRRTQGQVFSSYQNPHRSVDLGISSGSTSMLPSERFFWTNQTGMQPVLNTAKWGNLLFFTSEMHLETKAACGSSAWPCVPYPYKHMYVRTYVRTYVCMYVCMHACMYVISSWSRTLPPRNFNATSALWKKLARKDTALEAARAEHLAMLGIPGFRNCFRKNHFSMGQFESIESIQYSSCYIWSASDAFINTSKGQPSSQRSVLKEKTCCPMSLSMPYATRITRHANSGAWNCEGDGLDQDLTKCSVSR